MINSAGDQIKRGRYFSHSSFERVVNFHQKFDNFGLLAIAKASIGHGPKTITVEDDLFIKAKSSKEIYIDSESIQFFTGSGSYSFPLPNHRYNSKLNLEIKQEILNHGIERACNIAIEKSPEKSFVFLLSSEREKKFTGAFEKALLERVKQGVSEIFDKENLIGGIKLIKGVGTGLTPSGDDFITGILAAVTLIEQKEKINLENIKQDIKGNALGGNPFSNTYINLAANGSFTEIVKELLISLLNGHKVEEKAEQLISFGHSSGADLLTGILLGLKRRNSWLQKD